MKERALFLTVVFVGLATTLACDKSKDNPPPTPSATPSASTPVTAASTKPAAEAGAPVGNAATAEAATYAGKYTTTAAVLYIPSEKDWKGVKQAPDDASKHIGEGSMSLAVDGSGRVSGTIEAGPAAPAIVDGVQSDGEIRGTIRRKDPTDNGLTGTLQAKLAGANLEGTMKLAESNAAIVREGKLSLTKK